MIELSPVELNVRSRLVSFEYFGAPFLCQRRKSIVGILQVKQTHGRILQMVEKTRSLQELLRHANLKVTMDTYVQTVTDEKREAEQACDDSSRRSEGSDLVNGLLSKCWDPISSLECWRPGRESNPCRRREREGIHCNSMNFAAWIAPYRT